MIQADAHTNPLTWRRCQHLSQTVTSSGSRCQDCGAIDHGPTPTTGHRAVGMQNTVSGWSNGQYLFGLSTPPAAVQRVCQGGHPVSAGVMRTQCDICAAARRAALMLTPCAKGHDGQRFITTQGAMKCHTCESKWRKR